jgi:hypothetical protein
MKFTCTWYAFELNVERSFLNIYSRSVIRQERFDIRWPITEAQILRFTNLCFIAKSSRWSFYYKKYGNHVGWAYGTVFVRSYSQGEPPARHLILTSNAVISDS